MSDDNITYKFTMLTGTLKIKPGFWKVQPSEVTIKKKFLFWSWEEHETLWSVVPANEYAYVSIHNIGTYMEAINTCNIFNHYSQQ